MKMKLQLIAIGILFSLRVFADGYLLEPTQDQPWSVTASVGNAKYQHVFHKDGTTILGRLALGNELMLTGDFAWGFEFGVQNGNKMRLVIPNETLAILEWFPVKTALGPMLDLLITAKSDPLAGSSLFAQIKGGVAYRYWKIENTDVNNLSQVAGEIQAGFGYPLTTLSHLNLLYQGVFGGNPNFTINPYLHSGHVSTIPALHAVLVGFSINI
jgi:hypothetical protein